LKPVEITFRPVDNQRLAALCGTLDENLRQIETALDVGIARRGERFALTGKADQTRVAAQLLRSFYERAGSGLSLEDVQLGLIEAATPHQVRESGGSPQLITRRQDLHGRTQRQVQYLQNILSHDLTFSIGPAGTGKTYLAVACAVDALERETVKRIVLVRPAVEAGERLGFLPGDMAAKVDPYLRPLYDALYDMLDAERLAAYMERGTIEVAPLAFMRGRTLNDSFIVLDEAQNTSPEQMQMFLTRLGFGSKIVVTGDVTQIDLPREQASGLIQVREILAGIDAIAFVEFGNDDVVRHKLVQRIVEAYKRHAEETGTARRR
jgi:phosphate starvation-inducible PhoH-like protein